jgi:hypothetical protein
MVDLDFYKALEVPFQPGARFRSPFPLQPSVPAPVFGRTPLARQIVTLLDGPWCKGRFAEAHRSDGLAQNLCCRSVQ